MRYEDLALTVAVAIALFALKQRTKAAAVLCLAVLPLFGFSLFLKTKGLAILPSSVLVKGAAYAQSGSRAGHILHEVATNLMLVRHPERGTMLLLLVLLPDTRLASTRPGAQDHSRRGRIRSRGAALDWPVWMAASL